MPKGEKEMANSIDYASIFQQGLDEQMVQDLVTRGMEAQASQVKYTGGNEIKVLKMALTGLGNYSRNTGFPTSGSVTTTWETHTFDMDRGQEFNIDAMDNDESFVDIAAQTMSEFQRTEVAPEVDAYRFETIWDNALANDKVGRYTVSDSTIFEELSGDIATIQDVIGENEQLTIYMSYAAAASLDRADKITKRLDVGDFTGGGITTKVKMMDGIPIMRVPSLRFKTDYTYSATDGFSAGALASDINWIICANRSVIAIVKQDKVRTFSPDVNQDADQWKLQYRKYHTLIIPDNKIEGIYVNYAGVDAPELTATVAAGTGTGNTKFTATAGTGNTLGYILGAASSGAKYLDLIDDFDGSVEPYTSAADIAATAGQILTMCKVNSDGRIIELKEVTLASGDISS